MFNSTTRSAALMASPETRSIRSPEPSAAELTEPSVRRLARASAPPAPPSAGAWMRAWKEVANGTSHHGWPTASTGKASRLASAPSIVRKSPRFIGCAPSHDAESSIATDPKSMGCIGG